MEEQVKRSDCCLMPISVQSDPGQEGTSFYACAYCGEPCNPWLLDESEHPSRQSCPFTEPPDRPDLRTTRFEQEGEAVRRWVWEPSVQGWRLRSTNSRAELEAQRAKHEEYMRQHPITDGEWEKINEMARSIPEAGTLR